MERYPKSSKYISAARIMDSTLITSLIGSVVSSTFLGISSCHGAWVMGEISCQVFALVSYFLVSSAAWLSSLAAFERYYKVASPDDHLSTFSEVNSKILIAGTYMLSFVLCTGPLYGWGEYSHFKGKVLLTATLNIDESNFLSIPRSSLGFNGASYFCKPIAVTSQVPVMEALKGICYSFVTSEMPNVNIRTPSVNCTSGNVIFTLRSTDFSVIENIYNNHLAGKLSTKLAGALSFGFGKLLNTTANFSVQTSMDIKEISEYRRVFMPFQGLGVCTLDFSPVNEFVVSSTSYIIITTMLIPYSLTLFCAIAMYFKYHTGAVNPCFSDVTYLRIIYVCGSLALLLCLPYYTINYMNMHSTYVSKEANFVCTLLFYNSSLLVAIPYFLYRFPRIRFRRSRRERCTQAETIMLNGFCEESSTSRNSVKYDSV